MDNISTCLVVPRNGPAGLSPELRRIRHLKSIMARSLQVVGMHTIMHSYFTLHEDNPTREELEKPFYISEVVYNSNNPHWCSISSEKFSFKVPKSQNSIAFFHLMSPLFNVKIRLS